MARQEIDLTTPQPGGRQGEPTASAWTKVNDMTDEIYQAIPEVDPTGFTFLGDSNTEVMINVRAESGGVPVIHYNFKSPGGAGFPASGQLIGGAGSRPWVGAGWSDHSTAAYHLLASEQHTSSAQGTNFNVLTTPIGGTQANRVVAATMNGDGDIINSRGATSRKFEAAGRGRGIEIARDGGSLAEFSMISTAANYSTLMRMYSISGTLSSPGATLAGQSTGIGLAGWGSSAVVGSAAIIGMLAATNWTDTSRPTNVFFETTAFNTVIRVRRWSINDQGHFVPGADNSYDLGNGSTRVRQIYSNNATISTSDARMKQDICELTAEEVGAGVAIAKSIGKFKWKESIAEKGDAARWHFGVYAQRVVEIMRDHNLDPFAYGFVCFDEWEARDAVIGEDGQEVCAAVAAGNRYGIRYEQLSMFISAAIVAKLESI